MLQKTFFILMLLSLASAFAESALELDSGYAINGYDAVAYHKQKQAIKGQAKFSHYWQNRNWIFSSLENRELFAASPESYAPEYLGHCAYTLAQGSLASGNPLIWTLYQNKLYFHYSVSTKAIWQQDRDRLSRKANHHWLSYPRINQ